MPERFVLLFALAISSGFAVGQSNPEEHFEKKVRPLLVERCWKCHGEETSRNELRLDSREAILKGGKRGRAVETSIPPASLLLQVVKRTGELKMPPDGPLSPQQVADLELWVNQGAVFPKATKIAKAESSH
ncbi:MAG: c-type cytochrome domain-containing protein, partial [Planctomycetia bacterium]